jgi:hypothetical protein
MTTDVFILNNQKNRSFEPTKKDQNQEPFDFIGSVSCSRIPLPFQENPDVDRPTSGAAGTNVTGR